MDNMNKLIFGSLLFSIILFFAVHHSSSNTNLSALTAKLHALQNNPHQQIIIYGPEHIPQTIEGETYLKIYGIQETVNNTQTADDLLKKIPSLKQENIAHYTIPIFVLPDGEVDDSATLYPALAQLKAVDLHPGKTPPYIILYGVANCPYTARAKQQLDALGVAYEYIDLNSDAARYMGELGARLKVSGYQQEEYQTPLLEINGYVRPRSGVSEMISRIQVKR